MPEGGDLMYTVKQYQPKFSVVAYQGKTKYDLTKYILQVKTTNQLENPEGQFAILLTYEKHWERILGPMDYIEIRMTRYADNPNMIMRGFVSNIRRTRTMGGDGKWRRTITLNGNNYGKLLKEYQIYYMANIPGQIGQGSDNDPAVGLMVPKLFENMGIGGNGLNQLMPLNQFMKAIVEGINGKTGLIQAWINSLRKTTPAIRDLHVTADVLSDYQLYWLSLQSVKGSLMDVINQYANAPWCEWFIYDDEGGPQLYHRNTPFKDVNGKFIFPESALNPNYHSTIEITDEDVIEDDIGSSDAEVYDYFFTYPTNFSGGDIAYKFDVINSSNEFQNGGLSLESNANYPSNPKVNETNIYKYGLRIMEQASKAIPIFQNKLDPQSINLSVRMNMWLAQAYGWGSQMLNGTINLKGNENIKVGQYLFNKDAGEEYYVESVDHTFSVSQPNSVGNDNTFSYTTSVGVTRGRFTKTADRGVEPYSATATDSTYNSQSNSSSNNSSNLNPKIPGF